MGFYAPNIAAKVPAVPILCCLAVGGALLFLLDGGRSFSSIHGSVFHWHQELSLLNLRLRVDVSNGWRSAGWSDVVPQPSPGLLHPLRPCANDAAVLSAVWLNSIMWACCHTSPTRVRYECCHQRVDGRATGDTGLIGNIDWDTIPLANRSIVYVPAYDVPRFVARFKRLPSSARLTVVTGYEDVGVPRELWGAGRNLRGGRPEGALSDFLADPRLVRWFVQNYDLMGCNVYSGCSIEGEVSSAVARKVSPLPLGVSLLHTGSPCHSQLALNAMVSSLAPTSERHFAVLAAFSCDNHWAPTRRQACDALQRCKAGHVKATTGACVPSRVISARVSQEEYMRAIGAHMFVAAPVGRGIDTFRLWDALYLGSIPLVISSSLDKLLVGLPVVKLESWSQATNKRWLSSELRRIENRFGSDLRQPSAWRQKLSSAHWVSLIRRSHAAAIGWNGTSHLQGWTHGQEMEMQPVQPFGYFT